MTKKTKLDLEQTQENMSVAQKALLRAKEMEQKLGKKLKSVAISDKLVVASANKKTLKFYAEKYGKL